MFCRLNWRFLRMSAGVAGLSCAPAWDKNPASMNTPADCRGCGACCFSASPTFVRVTGADWTRLAERAEEVAQFIGHRAYMRMRDGHCSALDVRSREDGAADFYCTLYEQRPQICRDLGRGSPECRGERDAKASLVTHLVPRAAFEQL